MWISLAFFAVAAALGLAHSAVEGWIPTIPPAQDLGEVGAAYGAAAALISGFAFLAVVISMVGQKRQLQQQQAELQEQKNLLAEQGKALKATSQAQEEAARSL